MHILWNHKHRANWVRDTDKIFETELDKGSQYWHQLQKELDRYHFWKKELSRIQNHIIETKGASKVLVIKPKNPEKILPFQTDGN